VGTSGKEQHDDQGNGENFEDERRALDPLKCRALEACAGRMVRRRDNVAQRRFTPSLKAAIAKGSDRSWRSA
jgi:hypothetical protein